MMMTMVMLGVSFCQVVVKVARAGGAGGGDVLEAPTPAAPAAAPLNPIELSHAGARAAVCGR